ncbi:MAG: flagellar hook-associated protein 3, partial [Lachnospiraceae bacterium]|nr:flagellar hook-associated protein 3 [Lachnospiraceae bacterium]MDY4070082.1 flagellar hook-associated protein 3 [Lachnospiraceae bacterium]
MSMRITNKIMQNNSLTNINNNKVQQDKLSTQMETGKKITRPSDDPVIAIRALRLRSTLSEVTQYCDKNIEDADSWLSVT